MSEERTEEQDDEAVEASIERSEELGEQNDGTAWEQVAEPEIDGLSPRDRHKRERRTGHNIPRK